MDTPPENPENKAKVKTMHREETENNGIMKIEFGSYVLEYVNEIWFTKRIKLSRNKQDMDRRIAL